MDEITVLLDGVEFSMTRAEAESFMQRFPNATIAGEQSNEEDVNFQTGTPDVV